MIIALDVILGIIALIAWSIMLYKPYLKRIWDIILSFLALVFLSPLFLVLTILGALKMKGNPFFTQIRPGKKDKKGKERFFRLIKFRSMTEEKDGDGKLLPDDKRLTTYGKLLRSTSLDELPELINILKGDMSIVGPRPQLVRDMVFMTEEQKHRHDVYPGLTGLAQIRGRNAITWDEKLSNDLEYIRNESFFFDVFIIFKTIGKVFKREGISEDGMDTAEDYGDELLREGKVSKEEYIMKQGEALSLLREVSD